MKKALVLAGGGTRGSYQNGAVAALRKLGQDDWNLITGTSIGALNGTLLVQRDDAAMNHLWHTLSEDKIIKGGLKGDFKLDTLINERNLLASFFKSYVKEKGADITPFIHQVHTLYKPRKFAASDIDFGCITVKNLTQKPVYVNKQMMKEYGEDWLISTASCFPAFPIHRFKEGDFVDGGYFDNLPIDYALRLGAEEIIAIDLNNNPHHPGFLDVPHVHYLFPKVETGSFLEFDPKVLKNLETLGYNDAMKMFGAYDGQKYTFVKMDQPKFFDLYYRQILELETRVCQAVPLNDRLRSDSVIQNRVRENEHRRTLSVSQFCFGILDSVMDLCCFDPAEVYQWKNVSERIQKEFEETLNEDYEMIPGLKPKKIAEYAKTLDQKGIVAKIVHQNFYPYDGVLNDSILLTVYPYEKAMADFITALLRA